MSQTEQVITEKQKNLRIDQKIGEQMETLIPKMRELADSYNLARVREKSPFRNVLNVATESASGIEVTKNYIRYQLGRSGSNQMWRDKANGNESFAVALVREIEALVKDAEDVVQSIYEDPESELDKEDIQRVHLRLTQLYLGNLARYQAFLAYERRNN